MTIQTDMLLRDLEFLHEYLLGAYDASDNQNTSNVLHTAYHKIDDIMNNVRRGGGYCLEEMIE